ncbi:hypothetical protein ACLB2K_054017 [Fragaria x ananassa]
MVTCTWSDVLPFAAMVMVQFTDIGQSTINKAAMSKGVSSYVLVAYSNALGTIFLLPCFILLNKVSLTFSLLGGQFLLGIIGSSSLLLAYNGVNYSSPTLASAMANLIPIFTFILAVIFRMEKLDLRRSSCQAKVLGTIVSVSGAFVIIIYKGSVIFSPSNSPDQNFMMISQQLKWGLGGLMLAMVCLLNATWGILQALFGSLFHVGVQTWCLHQKGPIFVAMFRPLGVAIAAVMVVIFLGEALHLGSVIGSIIIAVGFYAMMWAQIKEKNTTLMKDEVQSLAPSSTQKTPLLQCKTSGEDFIDIGAATINKAAMSKGMSSYVLVVYSTALATVFLLPCFIFQKKISLTLSLLGGQFLLGLIGSSNMLLAYNGINFSSPTVASAMGNCIPIFTFILAIVFRMEKLDLRRSSCQAKVLGTIVSVSGAFVVILYKGSVIFSPSNSPHQNLMMILQQSNKWVIGGLMLAMASILKSSWNILQAIFGSLFHIGIETWCLHQKGPVFVAMFRPLAVAISAVMVVIFLGEALHLGSVIGSVMIAIGFYAMMWAQVKESSSSAIENEVPNLAATQKTPLLQCSTSAEDG